MDLVEFVEELHDEINPIIKIFKLLRFAFKADRVTMEKVRITAELKRVEDEYDSRFQVISEQIVTIQKDRESSLSFQEKLYLERVFIENALQTLNKIFKDESVDEETRKIAFSDSHTLLDAYGDSWAVAKITAEKMPELNINFGTMDIKQLN